MPGSSRRTWTRCTRAKPPECCFRPMAIAICRRSSAGCGRSQLTGSPTSAPANPTSWRKWKSNQPSSQRVAPEIELSPGMPTDVMILAGERTLLDYLVRPFVQVGNQELPRKLRQVGLHGRLGSNSAVSLTPSGGLARKEPASAAVTLTTTVIGVHRSRGLIAAVAVAASAAGSPVGGAATRSADAAGPSRPELADVAPAGR